jgi:putative transposase
VETPRGNLSQALGWLQVTYTVRFNRRWKRSGHLFQGRFKAQLVDAEGYGRSLVRYVHVNPVRPRDRRAVMASERAEELDQYEWNSHRDYAGLRRAPQWMCMDWLGFWGAGAAGRRAYRAFVREAFGKAVDSPWEDLRGGLVLGAESFWKKVQAMVGAKPGREERRWVQGESAQERQNHVRRLVEDQTDARVKMWGRVRLGGERMADVARELGYADGTGVTKVVRRLETAAAEDKELGRKLETLKSKMSRVRS